MVHIQASGSLQNYPFFQVTSTMCSEQVPNDRNVSKEKFLNVLNAKKEHHDSYSLVKQKVCRCSVDYCGCV